MITDRSTGTTHEAVPALKSVPVKREFLMAGRTVFPTVRICIVGLCWLMLWHPGQVLAKAPTPKYPGLEGPLEPNQGSQGSTSKDIAGNLPTEVTLVEDRCRGYYDVMGQWDPPFNCNASSYLYCCGTCGYRFCCQFKHKRLDQSTCSNYDTPNWASTGKPPARMDESPEDSTKDKTNMIVYIICGVVAVMVVVGIFTKLVLEKTQRPHTEMTRTLTELLKQPSHGHMDHVPDGHGGSIQVQITDMIARVSPHNSIGSATEEFYTHFPAVDVPGPGTPSFQSPALHPKDVSALPDGCSLSIATPIQKTKAGKASAHPLVSSVCQGWESSNADIRRQIYDEKRQFSTEKLPELFSQPSNYAPPQRHIFTNSKTEVTV
uniref:Protein shisa-8 n=1 Tax=Geotrypetes seraphini TaxID=260995 RepID=A0A6P8PXP9_GEOSA|nr:protein shisa-8 [Geotrypetes seraphini]